jgi:hypothetical protein
MAYYVCKIQKKNNQIRTNVRTRTHTFINACTHTYTYTYVHLNPILDFFVKHRQRALVQSTRNTVALLESLGDSFFRQFTARTA